MKRGTKKIILKPIRDTYKPSDIRLLQGEFICEKIDEKCSTKNCGKLHYCVGGECKCRYNFKAENEICTETGPVTLVLVSEGIFYELDFKSKNVLDEFDMDDKTIRLMLQNNLVARKSHKKLFKIG